MQATKLFYCYAHEDKLLQDQLVKQLASLERLGLIAGWSDRDISAGQQWQNEIDKRLNAADIILLLVSPDFIASNYCYSVEVKRAMERHEAGEARVIPIILRPVYWQAMLFGQLQALPTEGKPITTWSNSDEAFADIVAGIRSVIGNLSPSPLFQARPEDLRRVFDSLIADKTKDFVGRQFVFDALDAFLTGPDQESGYFIIRGEPGIGKSALMAQLVKQRSYIHHFNVALQAINTPRQFLSSVFAQLISLFQLDHVVIPDDAYESGMFLNQLLGEASRRLGSGKRLVIAVDALDEVDTTGFPTRTNVLYLPWNLPKGIFIVATTRPTYDLHLQVSDLMVLDLESDSEGNVQDVRHYIQSSLADEQMQQRLLLWQVTSSYFIEKLLAKSEGNFMYLRYVLPAIKAGRFLHGTVDELPNGLLAYYRIHWAQMRDQDTATFDVFYKPVVCVLAAVKESVSVDQIAAFTGLEQDRVGQVVKEWREFLHEIKAFNSVPVYRIYHTTFQEFLGEEVDPGLRTYHKMIVIYYLKLKEGQDG